MNIRRTFAATVASLAVAATVVLGTATPAAAVPPIRIPACASMFAGAPTYWATFASINGDTAVRYNPTPQLYGSDIPALKNMLRDWGATNCTWRLEHGKTTQNFSISEVAMSWKSDAILRRWYASHGIVGVDSEATLGGVLYQVSPTEMHLLIHGRGWIAITARHTSIYGYTAEAAAYTIANLNPWIYSGTE